MTHLSRRSLLRSGATLALGTTIAGCSGGSDTITTANDGIPGVEDGEIVDHHTFANAHGDQLAARTGTVDRARVWLDRETGDPERHTVSTVRADGDRVHAVVSGRPLVGKSDIDRLEVYFGDDATTFMRTRTDGEWTTSRVDMVKASFTGTSRLEGASMSKVGTETVDGEELHRFTNAERGGDDAKVEWFDIQALVDDDALVHSFHQTLAGTEGDIDKSEEWHLMDLGATTVDQPDWVAEAGA